MYDTSDNDQRANAEISNPITKKRKRYKRGLYKNYDKEYKYAIDPCTQKIWDLHRSRISGNSASLLNTEKRRIVNNIDASTPALTNDSSSKLISNPDADCNNFMTATDNYINGKGANHHLSQSDMSEDNNVDVNTPALTNKISSKLISNPDADCNYFITATDNYIEGEVANHHLSESDMSEDNNDVVRVSVRKGIKEYKSTYTVYTKTEYSAVTENDFYYNCYSEDCYDYYECIRDSDDDSADSTSEDDNTFNKTSCEKSNDYKEIMFEGYKLTVIDVLKMIMAFCLRFQISTVARSAMMDMVNYFAIKNKYFSKRS